MSEEMRKKLYLPEEVVQYAILAGLIVLHEGSKVYIEADSNEKIEEAKKKIREKRIEVMANSRY